MADPPDSSSSQEEELNLEPGDEEIPEGFNIRRGLRNAGWLVGGNYMSYLVSFVTVIVVARPLGPKGYGLVSAILAFVGVLSFTQLTGFDRVVVRSGVREEEQLEALLNLTVGLKTVAGFGAALVAVVAAWVLPGISFQERVGVTIASATLVMSPLIGTYSTACQVHEDMRWIAIAALLRQITYVVSAGVLIILFGANPVLVVAAFTGAYVLQVVFARQVAARWISPRPDFDFRKLEPAFVKAGLLFTFIGFFTFFYTRVDILMIQAFTKNLTAVGWYAAALTLFSRISVATDGFSLAFFPQIVRQAKGGMLVLAHMRKGVLALAAIGTGVAVAGWVLAPWVVPLILGRAFTGAVLPFQILLVSLAVSMPFYPLVLLFQARGMELMLAKIIPTRAVLNIVLDVVVLSLGWGIVGVAVGTLVTSIVYFAALTIVAARLGMLVPSSGVVEP